MEIQKYLFLVALENRERKRLEKSHQEEEEKEEENLPHLLCKLLLSRYRKADEREETKLS